jgi:hypothetical protein
VTGVPVSIDREIHLALLTNTVGVVADTIYVKVATSNAESVLASIWVE